MLAPGGMLAVCVAWAVFSYGVEEVGFSWWYFLWLSIMAAPLASIGKKKWSDSDEKKPPNRLREEVGGSGQA